MTTQQPSDEAMKIAKDFEYHCERNPEEGLATAYVARVVDRALKKKFEEAREAAARICETLPTEYVDIPSPTATGLPINKCLKLASKEDCAKAIRAMKEPQ